MQPPVQHRRPAKKKARLPESYEDQYLVTYNPHPPTTTAGPQLSIITTAEHIRRNMAQVHDQLADGEDPHWIWLVLGAAPTQELAENLRRTIDQNLRRLQRQRREQEQ